MSRLSSFLDAYPEAEVKGGSVLAIRAAMGEIADPYFEAQGLGEIDPDGWYSFKKYLNILYDILDNESDVLSNLVSIGMNIVQTAQLPPEIDSLDKALNALQVTWALNSRNAHEINWEVEHVDDHTYVCTNHSPFPPDVEYGVVYGFARRFSGNGHFVLSYDDLADREDDNTTSVRFVLELEN